MYINVLYQGRIEPQRAYNGHSTYVDSEVLNVTKNSTIEGITDR
jgi:hypothetical protein